MSHRTFPRFVAAAAAIFLVALDLSHELHATNGMNMEGYGPVSTALGGASFAYDNGTAAVINNPATLSLIPGNGQLDLAVGILGPSITTTAPSGARATSQAKAFFMPALGYARHAADLTWGFGLFGQGGMGCEYDEDSWRGLGFGLKNRTEVSVGRAIVPVSWKVNDKLSVAATADFVWAGMDLQMAMSGAQFMDLVTPGAQTIGRASGTLVQSFGQIMQQMPAGTSVDYAYFDFANGSDFTGEAQGTGFATKVGLVYEVSNELAVGLTYHTKTRLSDLKAPGNSLSFQLDVPGMGAMPQTLAGDFTVRNFEWPAMMGVGLAWKAAPTWLVAADVRHVQWADVMQRFDMRFVASDAAANGPFAGQRLDAQLYQNWRDQTSVQIGAAWQASRQLTVRLGFNHATDPIPDRYLNCLFPATVEDHLTGGLGWSFGERSGFDWSVTYGLKHSATNGSGVRVEHAQLNTQVLYSFRF